jgi:hypothetical protein
MNEGSSSMQINVRTDDNIVGSAELIESVQAEVAAALDRFSERITRVEVHLRDANAGKTGARDKECMMEARLTGRAPVAVNEAADSLGQAVAGCSEKIARLIDSTLGRTRDSHRRDSVRGQEQVGPGASQTGTSTEQSDTEKEP